MIMQDGKKSCTSLMDVCWCCFNFLLYYFLQILMIDSVDFIKGFNKIFKEYLDRGLLGPGLLHMHAWKLS
jgi:hypothetical protein